ncbi:MAG: type I-E CRISPR-associated protein Cas5/CasD [Acetobacteraceae bacterium]
MTANTLFLRLEGPLQAWGDQQSKFVIRRTAEAPTKSGVAGMLCAALGIPRPEAPVEWLPKLAALRMGVRIDMPGIRWWDYQTVGARMSLPTAAGETKAGAMLTRREYLCDASFLVALWGGPALIAGLAAAIRAPKWALYLGRKCCPPSRPLFEHGEGEFPDTLSALRSVPWRRRLAGDPAPQTLNCLLDWQPTPEQPQAPEDALVWYDVPRTFDPPAHEPRIVTREQLQVSPDEVKVADQPAQQETPAPPRPTADYADTEYRNRRNARLESDFGLCVLCKSPAATVHHVTYRRAGGSELPDDLRSLCRLCHDAVTMIEYGLGMGLDRVDPEDPEWRGRIVEKRGEIVKFRSLETRRRRLAPEEVE